MFGSDKVEFSDLNIDKPHNELSSRVERWKFEGSGWTINSIIQCQLVISDIASCEGSFYFPLPKELRNPMKGLINIQNEDKESIRSCLCRYLNPVNKNSAEIRNFDKEFAKQLDLKSIKFTVHKKTMQK